MIELLINENLKNTEFKSPEDKHLSLLLFMRNAQKFLISAGSLLGDNDHYKPLEKLFYSLPDEVLNDCGYSKNYNSFDKIHSLITHTLRNETLVLAMETLIDDLPHTKGLEFLKVKEN